MNTVAFTVHGLAQPAGSKRGFLNKKTGRVAIVDDAKKSRPWKTHIEEVAAEAMAGRDLLRGPLMLELAFFIPRPKGHYRTGTNSHLIRDSAPGAPTVKPDLLKLARAVEDALTGVVYLDDAQIVQEVLRKYYTTAGGRTEVKATLVEFSSVAVYPVKANPLGGVEDANG